MKKLLFLTLILSTHNFVYSAQEDIQLSDDESSLYEMPELISLKTMKKFIKTENGKYVKNCPYYGCNHVEKQGNMARHIRKIHTNEQKYKCKSCNFTTPDASILKYHIRKKKHKKFNHTNDLDDAQLREIEELEKSVMQQLLQEDTTELLNKEVVTKDEIDVAEALITLQDLE